MTGGEKTKNSNIDLAQGKAGEALASKELFSWEASSSSEKPKSKKWYAIALIVISVVIAYSVWQKDWFIIIITILVSAIMFWYIHFADVAKTYYKITPMGIYVDEKLHPFSEIHSFWMVYNQRVKVLYIVFTKKYLPTLNISLENIDPVSLKSFLIKKIPEQEKRGETLADKITRTIGI